jgi:hypothetical protein
MWLAFSLYSSQRMLVVVLQHNMTYNHMENKDI